MKNRDSMETISTRKKIKEPWCTELGATYCVGEMDYMALNLINAETGEMRQKMVSVDFVVRRCFGKARLRDVEVEEKNQEGE